MIPEEFKYKYIAILRCRTWGIWPEGQRVVSRGLVYKSVDNKIGFSVHIVSYEQRPRPENYPAEPCKNYDSPIVWRGRMDTGYWVGDQVLKAPEDELKIEFDHKGPFQGEIDVQLHIGAIKQLDVKEVDHFINSVAYSVISYINIVMNEFIIPVAPLQIRSCDEEGSRFENDIYLACRERPVIKKEELEKVLKNYIEHRRPMTSEDERIIDVAMRRFLSAQNETDIIDKYCDLWEVCEFISFVTNAKGGKVGKIAKCLADHISASGNNVSKAKIENFLNIKKIYKIRGSIVHNAVDNPELVKSNLPLLNEMALELIKYKAGFVYSGNNLIDKTIA